ncbi:tripartite motif-containing protein 16-like [Ictalurus punctatus]|uniref:Tripartite motif-containing protein 16-like n=1 Tax=Ictalurus punctatus TaxID=7998 RepID=A0A9F7R7E6_ICTPU|nr:tripartite motif-containing protein 16-like [Ictalurus punctatus]
MAEANILGLQDQFSCPLCLDLIKDPVTIVCGHTFCMVCINGCWDQEDQKGVYSCPQCRQTFTPRPVVSKNTVLAEVVETLKKTGLQATRPAHCSAGPEDVECDSCTGRKSKAIKSCLVCLASFCETHLQPHYESPAFKKHKLVEASRRLQEQICSQHDELLEVYCHTEQQCICMLCTMDEHKGHDTVSAAAGRADKQKQLLEVQGTTRQRIQEREKQLQELTKAVKTHKHSAQTAVHETEKLFTALIKSIERRCSELTALIRAQEKAAVSRAEEVMKQLEQEIAELKRRDSEMEELSHTEDPIHFLQSFQSVSITPKSAVVPTISPHLTFEDVVESVSNLREKVEECSKEEFGKILAGVSYVWMFPVPEPRSREDFLKYSCQLRLNPNTANKLLCLSEENTLVTCSSTQESYPDHAERFEYYLQVLCTESVCGRCYWEVEWSVGSIAESYEDISRKGNRFEWSGNDGVPIAESYKGIRIKGYSFEWSGNDGVSIAVSYKDISRKGNGCVFGFNDQSWRLLCSPNKFIFCHNNREISVPVIPSSSRIGVYVDHRAGILSFYGVSDTMKLLHSVRTTFTQPLYPGFMVCKGSRVKLCHLK